MKIVVYGTTETRPFIYTLLKVLQASGRVYFQTENPHYKRLVDDGADVGSFENIFIAVSSDDTEEIAECYDLDMKSFKYELYDSIIPDSFDCLIYIKGAKQVDYEQAEMEEYITSDKDQIDYKFLEVQYGFGPKSIPYSVETFLNIEKIEAYRELIEVDKRLTKQFSSILQDILNLPANTIRKLVAKKR